MSDSLNDPLLETEAVAEHLRIQPVTVESWRQLGRGPQYIKVGRLVRYRQSDIDAWLRSQTVTGNAA